MKEESKLTIVTQSHLYSSTWEQKGWRQQEFLLQLRLGERSAESGSGMDSVSLKCAAPEWKCWPQVQLCLKDPREVGKWPCVMWQLARCWALSLSHKSAHLLFPFCYIQSSAKFARVFQLCPSCAKGHQGQVLHLTMAVTLEGGKGSTSREQLWLLRSP